MGLSPGLIAAGGVLDAGEARVGGKALGLARLVRAGATVPPFFVVPGERFESHLRHSGVGSYVAAELARVTPLDPGAEGLADLLAGVAERIGRRVRDAALDRRLEAEVEAALPSLGPGPYAVRSSLVGEDAADRSFAGQLASFLFQPGAAEVLRSLRSCWASPWSARALAYRLHAGLPLADVRMGVVVQRMVDGRVSGVLFTANPVNGRRDECLLNAAWGQGQGVVAGRDDADELVLSHDGRELAARLARKRIRVARAPSGVGTAELEVPPADRDRRCLTADEARAVCREGVRLAAALGCPQDVEWTLDGDTLYLLQSRPVTSLPEPAEDDGPLRVWDNSNIQESYCGVTTPLTFSFASAAYASVYEQTMRAVGLPRRVVEEHRPLLRNLLGLVRGRVYYNVDNWYRGLLLLPSFRRNKADMERMMGLEDPVDFIEDERPGLGERWRRTPRLVLTLGRLLVAFAGLRRSVPRFLEGFEAAYRRVDRAELERASYSRLLAVLDGLRRDMLGNWHVPIVNDFRVMMATGRLRRLVAAGGADPAKLLPELLGGEGLESTEPTRHLMALAAEAAGDDALRTALATGTASEAFERVRAGWPALAERLDAYVERYGDRVMGELKLETVTLRQDRELLRQVLCGYLERGDLDPEGLAAVQRERRAAAVEGLEGGLGFLARRRLRGAVRSARAAVRDREALRLCRTRMFGLFRDVFLAIGRRLAEAGRLADARDVFYLTQEEVEAYHQGRGVSADLAGLVAARRAEYAAYEEQPLPHRFTTRGPVYHGNRYEPPRSAAVDVAAPSLRGLGCCPGVAEAAARVVLSPGGELKVAGRILVAERTDPGWTPLFPLAAGLLVERGSLLSHSAVVARELGVPAIVGIRDLTRIVADGERLRMDGETGLVERLGRKP